MTDTTTDSVTPFQPIVGSCAWTGPEMAGRTDWLHVFTPAEIEEIETAVAAIKTRGLSILDIKQADFPLPTLAPVLARIRDDLVDGCGISVMRGLPVDRWSREETAIAYWGLGAHLGDAVSQNPDGHMLGHVKDIGGDFHSLTSRAGYQSHARLPFHTDVGADLVGLLCLHPSKAGGESSVTSAAAVHNAMLERRPDLLRLLAAPIHRDRRGEYLAGKAPTYEAPVFCHHAGHMTVTFVRRFIESAPRHPGVPPVTPALVEAMDLLEALAESDDLRLDMDFRAGRHSVDQQPHHLPLPHRIRGLAGAGAAPAPAPALAQPAQRLAAAAVLLRALRLRGRRRAAEGDAHAGRGAERAAGRGLGEGARTLSTASCHGLSVASMRREHEAGTELPGIKARWIPRTSRGMTTKVKWPEPLPPHHLRPTRPCCENHRKRMLAVGPFGPRRAPHPHFRGDGSCPTKACRSMATPFST